MFEYALSVFVLFGLTLLFFTIGQWILTFSFKNSAEKMSRKEITDCKNPNCVRCTLYSEVTQIAKTRLEEFIDTKLHKNAYGRIEHSFLRSINPSEFTSSESLLGISQNPNVFKLNNLQSRPVFDNTEFAMDIDILKENYDVIYSDFCKIHKDKYFYGNWLRNDTPMGKWSVFHLVNQGKPVDRNIDMCKNTFAIVNTLRSIMCNNVFGNVVFSVVEPNTVISEHYGPTNVRVRCHLGLVTPTTCTLSISNLSRTWTRGDCLVFDDSFSHGVQHRGSDVDGFRAVLIVDLWHPGVTDEEKVALDYIFAPR